MAYGKRIYPGTCLGPIYAKRLVHDNQINYRVRSVCRWLKCCTEGKVFKYERELNEELERVYRMIYSISPRRSNLFSKLLSNIPLWRSGVNSRQCLIPRSTQLWQNHEGACEVPAAIRTCRKSLCAEKFGPEIPPVKRG